MLKKQLFPILLSTLCWFGAVQPAFAVPVRTYGGVNANSGYYSFRSENTGNGNLTPGNSVTVDSYLFQCKSSGPAACSTEHDFDATLVNTWHNQLTVPQLNQSTSSITHNFSLPYGNCGRLQYDQGVVGIDGAIGGWVYDFGVDCQTPPPVNTCENQQHVNTQFRFSGNGPWINGNDMTARTVKVGQQVDVNCFAQTGTALLEGGVIDVTLPNGQTYRINNSPELRNYTLPTTGNYRFSCSSTTIQNCGDSDSFNAVVTQPTPTPTPTPIPTPSPQVSSCDSLSVVGGNDGLVPARVTVRASGSDNRGNIQSYRFFFGDGSQIETTNQETTHDYTISGNFLVRVEVRDSMGNYKNSSACQTEVRVKSSNVESHKSGCSDVFITANNGSKAPSLVQFTVTGFDNKGNIQSYRLDFGNGITKDSDGRTLEQIYDRSGTYEVKAYVKDSNSEWVGGTDNCRRIMTIGSTIPLTRQPSTGTPTALPVIGFGSGIIGLTLQIAKRRLKA